MSVNTVQVRKKGSITLPMDLRTKYGVAEGDAYSLIDMGDGSFLFTPRVSQVNRLGDRVAEILSEDGVSLEDLLTALDEEREHFYQERYAAGTPQHGKE